MDNYIKHLLDKIQVDKEFTKTDNKNTIKIFFKKDQDDLESYLKSMSDTYRIILDILNYLKTIGKVVVECLTEEIVIIY